MPAVQCALLDLDAGEVTVDGGADAAAVRRAIVDAGYDIRKTA